MDFALSDITFSDVGIHVAGSLAAFIVVDVYKSIFSRDRSGRQGQGSVSARSAIASDQSSADSDARRGWLSLLVGWLLLFAFKFVIKATLALLAAGFAIGWLEQRVNLAEAYRLPMETANTLEGAVFLLVMVLAWWLLPIRLFKR